MNKLITFLDAINENVGKIFSWTTFLMVIVIAIDVICRYLFSFSFIWIVELEIYLFALSFLFASGYAFKQDMHVRVDVFYAKMSKKKQAIVNLIGGLFFLLPWTVIAIMVCYRYAMNSSKIGERSAQPGGLPALYILKFIIVLGFVLLLIQGISSILKSIQVLRGREMMQSKISNEKVDGTWEL